MTWHSASTFTKRGQQSEWTLLSHGKDIPRYLRERNHKPHRIGSIFLLDHGLCSKLPPCRPFICVHHLLAQELFHPFELNSLNSQLFLQLCGLSTRNLTLAAAFTKSSSTCTLFVVALAFSL